MAFGGVSCRTGRASAGPPAEPVACCRVRRPRGTLFRYEMQARMTQYWKHDLAVETLGKQLACDSPGSVAASMAGARCPDHY